MTSPTATLETLTASVHVLKMGNRQITLGVYHQLDSVQPDKLNALGRVRIPGSKVKDWGEHPEIVRILGKHRETGALVKAHLRDPEMSFSGQGSREAAIEAFAQLLALPLIILAGAR